MDSSDEDTMKKRADKSSSSEEEIAQPKETQVNSSMTKTGAKPNDTKSDAASKESKANTSIRLDKLGNDLSANNVRGQNEGHYNQNSMFQKKNDNSVPEDKGFQSGGVDSNFQGRGGNNKEFDGRGFNTNNSNFQGRGGNNFGRESNDNGGRRNYNRDNNGYGRRQYNNYNQGGRYNRYNRQGDQRQDNEGTRQRYGAYNNYHNQHNSVTNDPFYITNKNLILDIIRVFPEMKEKDILIFLKTRSMGCRLTIFEIMNALTRESRIISHLTKVRSANRQICSRLEITETPYSNDIIDEQIRVLKHYKVHSQLEKSSHDLPDDFYYKNDSERRRTLGKDVDGLYNYIPRLYVSYFGQNLSGFGQNSNVELYAKNLNEVDYHSLQYKTVLCRKDKCELSHCPNAHNMEQDFRLIYEYRKEAICKLMLSLLGHTELLRIENYLDHFDIPLTFNLSNFKIHRCELHFMGNACHVDPHLCLCYHNQKEEKRRPPGLFRYQNEKCPRAQPENGGEYRESYCPYGMFCPNLHSKAEMNYHEDNFRQVFQCTRKRKNGKCIYQSTCYGIHDYSDGEEEDKDNDMSNNDLLEQLHQECTKEMDKVSRFTCHSCGNIPQDVDGKRTYCVNKKCGDFLCMKCFKECIKAKPPKCSCCQGQIVKGEMFKVTFTEDDDEDKE